MVSSVQYVHRFKYCPSWPRYRPISHFCPAVDTIWEYRSPVSFAAKWPILDQILYFW